MMRDVKIKIRQLKRTDFKEWCKSEISYQKEFEKDKRFGLGSIGWTTDKKYFKKEFFKSIKGQKSGKSVVLIADDNGHIVGECSIVPSGWLDAPHIGEMGFSVIKEYRGKGIGLRLAKEALKLAKGKYEIISAGTFKHNKASRELLKKLGFIRWGTAPNWVKRGKLYFNSEFYYLGLNSRSIV